MSVKFLHQAFTEEEFEKLLRAKGEKSWRNFILELTKNDETENMVSKPNKTGKET